MGLWVLQHPAPWTTTLEAAYTQSFSPLEAVFSEAVFSGSTRQAGFFFEKMMQNTGNFRERV